jgi:hypothetical protein
MDNLFPACGTNGNPRLKIAFAAKATLHLILEAGSAPVHLLQKAVFFDAENHPAIVI